MTATTTELTSIAVDPLTPTIGAEISGVDLAVPLPDRQQGEIHQVLLDWDNRACQHYAVSDYNRAACRSA